MFYQKVPLSPVQFDYIKNNILKEPTLVWNDKLGVSKGKIEPEELSKDTQLATEETFNKVDALQRKVLRLNPDDEGMYNYDRANGNCSIRRSPALAVVLADPEVETFMDIFNIDDTEIRSEPFMRFWEDHQMNEYPFDPDLLSLGIKESLDPVKTRELLLENIPELAEKKGVKEVGQRKLLSALGDPEILMLRVAYDIPMDAILLSHNAPKWYIKDNHVDKASMKIFINKNFSIAEMKASLKKLIPEWHKAYVHFQQKDL